MKLVTTHVRVLVACGITICATGGVACLGSVDDYEVGHSSDTGQQTGQLRPAEATVVVCHVPGGDRMKARDLSVPQSAVAGHVAHGDAVGPCGYCMRLANGTACDDQNLCTTGDTCTDGACVAGTPATCSSGDACLSIACNPATGACEGAWEPNGKPCADGACQSGYCSPSGIPTGTTRTFHCPLESTASGGYVAASSPFLMVLEYNNVYDGPVSLLSHLDRGFANYDIGPQPDNGFQLMCVYKNADGLQIGAISLITTAVGGCTTTTASDFVCSN